MMRMLRGRRTGTSGRRPRRRGWVSSTLRGQAGVSIIEVLVSVVVLAIVVVPIFNSLVAGRTLTAHRGEKRMALRLVERKVEQLMRAGYGASGSDSDVSSINLTSGLHPADPSIVVNVRRPSDTSDDLVGSLTWNVVPVAWPSPGDSVRAKVVEVRMTWPASSPRDSVSVTTIVGA
jgi:Tfp pilus assembly protein PilV